MTETEPTFPRPDLEGIGAPFWGAVAKGELHIMTCKSCGNAFLPAREECPNCLSDQVGWTKSSGKGQIVSWVEYHRALHPAFKDRLPYSVVLIELEEGARMISNISGLKSVSELEIDMPVTLAIETVEGVRIPRFKIDGRNTPGGPDA